MKVSQIAGVAAILAALAALNEGAGLGPLALACEIAVHFPAHLALLCIGVGVWLARTGSALLAGPVAAFAAPLTLAFFAPAPFVAPDASAEGPRLRVAAANLYQQPRALRGFIQLASDTPFDVIALAESPLRDCDALLERFPEMGFCVVNAEDAGGAPVDDPLLVLSRRTPEHAEIIRPDHPGAR
ncbi:MAG: hypothetical protein AAF527_12340, partial [Pseudomonadota bacterium]